MIDVRLEILTAIELARDQLAPDTWWSVVIIARPNREWPDGLEPRDGDVLRYQDGEHAGIESYDLVNYGGNGSVSVQRNCELRETQTIAKLESTADLAYATHAGGDLPTGPIVPNPPIEGGAC